MNGDIGFYTILPDQIQVINPILILAFIPLFTYGVYPLLAKCNLVKTPLQKMVCGGLLTAASFAISASISMAIEATDPVLPSAGNAQIRIYNPLKCNVTLEATPYINKTEIESMGYRRFVVKPQQENIQFTVTGVCTTGLVTGDSYEVPDGKAVLFYLWEKGLVMLEDDIDKDESGLPKIR